MANTVITEQIANGEVFANGFYGTGIATGFSFRAQSFGLAAGSTQNNFVDVFQINMTTYASGPATLFFYNYASADRVEIYQGDNLIASTNNAINLTTADRAFLLSDAAGQFFNDSPDLYMRDFVASDIGGDAFATYAGKITWTHDPAGGAIYKIKARKGTGGADWRYLVQYPIDGFTVGCPPIPPATPPPPPPITIIIQDPPPAGGGGSEYFYFDGILYRKSYNSFMGYNVNTGEQFSGRGSTIIGPDGSYIGYGFGTGGPYTDPIFGYGTNGIFQDGI